MPKRFSRDERPKDVNQLAYQLVRLSTEDQQDKNSNHESEISRVMSEMGRKGGKIGGKRSLQTMTPEERRERALRAAQARWRKEPRGSPRHHNI